MSDDFISTKGKIVDLRLNVTKKKADGGTWKAHAFLLETEDGEQQKLLVNIKSKAGPFIEKLRKGQEVTVKQKDDKFKNVVAVFSNEFKTRSKSPQSESRTFDPTGPIQGNVLTNAVNFACALVQRSSLNTITSEDIVSAAKEILKAKETIDSLVLQALKSKGDSHVNTKSSSRQVDEDMEGDEEMDEEDEFSSKSSNSPY